MCFLRGGWGKVRVGLARSLSRRIFHDSRCFLRRVRVFKLIRFKSGLGCIYFSFLCIFAGLSGISMCTIIPAQSVYYANAGDLPDRSLVDHASPTTHFTLYIYIYIYFVCMGYLIGS